MPTGGANTGDADPTAMMPPVPPGPPRGEDPHPWQSQLQAARDRNEQTQVQYLDPSQDPLRRRPQRQQPPQQQYPPQGRPQQQRPQQQPYAPQSQQYPPQHQQQRYAPPPPQQQQYAPPQQPPPQQPTPRQARQPRQPSPNRMRIPGLGCLKGCLFTLVLLFVAGWLVWELTPLQDWVAQGKGYWEAIGDGISKVSNWISDLGSSDPGTSNPGTGSGAGQ